jgi:multidrug efflux pump subunit AcrB
MEIQRVATEVRDVMAANPNLRLAHFDWGERTPNLHVVLDQERLRLIGLTPKDAALQLATVLNGAPAIQVREGLRIVDVLVRAPSSERAGPARNRRRHPDHGGRPLCTAISGRALDTRTENAVLKHYNRETYIAVEGDVFDGKQPPDITAEILPKLEAIKAKLPDGYRIDTGGSVEESKKADVALGAVFPLMLVVTLTVIMLQVRSFSMMAKVFLTAPLGLVGAVPTLLVFHQPFGFNAILGLIGLAGILMRNTLILVDQIRHDREAGLSAYDAVVESTVRRARPVVLTAAAAMLAFIPLTHSTFWGSLAYMLIGGVGVGTVLRCFSCPPSTRSGSGCPARCWQNRSTR